MALANRKNSYHEIAKACYEKIKMLGYKLVTSDYVLDETITILFRNVAFIKALMFVDAIFSMIKMKKIRLEKVNAQRFEAAWVLRKKYQDKPDISFTDFTSFVIMQEKGIRKVFTGNSHFRALNLGFEIFPEELK